MDRKQAKRAVKRIIADLADRGGIGDEWHQIDDDIKSEIRQAWVDIVEEAGRE